MALDERDTSLKLDVPSMRLDVDLTDPAAEELRPLQTTPRYCRAVIGSGFMRRSCMKLYPCPIHRSERQ